MKLSKFTSRNTLIIQKINLIAKKMKRLSIALIFVCFVAATAGAQQTNNVEINYESLTSKLCLLITILFIP
jgi:hypothetical protein